MAQVIKAGFARLSATHHTPTAEAVVERASTFAELAQLGESLTVEFKSSMIHSYRADVPEKVITGSVLKTIAAFLNTEGGTLVIGADDDAHPLGIDADLKTKNFNRDSYENFIITSIANAIDTVAAARCRVRFENLGETTVCLVDVEPSSRPVYASTEKGKDVFFVRTGNATRALETKEVVAYIQDRFGVA
jgi:predicted HTH transcriptional regulator